MASVDYDCGHGANLSLLCSLVQIYAVLGIHIYAVLGSKLVQVARKTVIVVLPSEVNASIDV